MHSLPGIYLQTQGIGNGSNRQRGNTLVGQMAQLPCTFHSRTGFCPFRHSQCGRTHEPPTKSCFLVLKVRMNCCYVRCYFTCRCILTLSPTSAQHLYQQHANETSDQVKDFYADILQELQHFGEVQRMEVIPEHRIYWAEMTTNGFVEADRSK